MRRLILFFLLLTVVTGCTNRPSIFVLCENSSGLSQNSQLRINGFPIGQVKELELLENNKTLVEVELTEEIEIPVDSEFSINSNSLFGDSSLDIQFGQSKVFLVSSDTVRATFMKRESELEMNINNFVKNLVELTDSLKSEKDSTSLDSNR